jgi:hypothetical protein
MNGVALASVQLLNWLGWTTLSEKCLRILVVEDIGDRAAAVVGRLKDDGDDVHVASDEITARVVGRRNQLNAAIVFLRPDGASIELAAYLRTNLLDSTAPLVAIDPEGTGAAGIDTQAFDVVLNEPVDLPQLSSLLHHLCFQRQS